MGNFHGVARAAKGSVKYRKAAIASVALSALFMIVYSAINWLTGLRQDVGELYLGWERHIPFLAWMIVPYMSIDLFFVAAPFLCKTDEELNVFAKRVTFCVLVAGASFLLFPLRFAFPRPAVDGLFGSLFHVLGDFDQPFNLLPSQHILLLTILASVYLRHTRGLARWLVSIWFSLIALSTIFTYQHHIIDVLSALLIVGYAFYLFPHQQRRIAFVPNGRIGDYYLAGFVALAWIILNVDGWGALLLWPASSLLIVAAGYYQFGPAIYRKRNGRITLSTWLVLGPVLVGQYLSLVFFRSRSRAYDEVLPNVWIGRALWEKEAEAAIAAGVTAVVDLTAEMAAAKPFRNLKYLNIPILDLTAPGREQLREIAAFIEEQSREGIVYVHCKLGYTRSAMAVAAYLIESGRCASVEEAVEVLREARPSIVIRPEVLRALAAAC
jgi:membrane-associated phospholipid phosphatase